MTAQVVPFIFQQQYSVRVILIDNEPWFCLVDVCAVLDIKNQNPDRFQFDSKGVTKNVIPTKGGEQEATFINEPNLYRVIFRSNKPEARKFQDWIFNEVIPAIRKTGRYEVPQPDLKPRLTTEQWKVLDRLIHDIGTCCHAKGRARFAASERIRFGYGLTQSRDLPPEHFDTAKADLESLYALAEQHQN
ncbi:MAG: BRO family protein, partial [Nitrosomonas ureae]